MTTTHSLTQHSLIALCSFLALRSRPKRRAFRLSFSLSRSLSRRVFSRSFSSSLFGPKCKFKVKYVFWCMAHSFVTPIKNSLQSLLHCRLLKKFNDMANTLFLRRLVIMHMRLVGALCLLITHSTSVEHLEENPSLVMQSNVFPVAGYVPLTKEKMRKISCPTNQELIQLNASKRCTSRFSRGTKTDLLNKQPRAKSVHRFICSKAIHSRSLNPLGPCRQQSTSRSHSQQMMENARNKRHYRVVLISLLAFVGIYVLCFTPRFATRVLFEVEAFLTDAISPELLLIVARVGDFCQPLYALLAFLIHIVLSRRFRHDLCGLISRTRSRIASLPARIRAVIRGLLDNKRDPESSGNLSIRSINRASCRLNVRTQSSIFEPVPDKQIRRLPPLSSSADISDLHRRYALMRNRRSMPWGESGGTVNSLRARVSNRLRPVRKFLLSYVSRAYLPTQQSPLYH